MSSTNVSYPNLNEFISLNNEYIKPTINNKDAAYYVLTNTSNKYIINNNAVMSKNIEIGVFAVGGGGGGGLENGSGGNGGNVIFSNIIANVNDILELSVGKGAYYLTNNQYVNGLRGILYSGYLPNMLLQQNSYIMNMNPVDISNLGLKKQWERNISDTTSISSITNNEIIPIVFKGPNDIPNYYDNRFNYDNIICQPQQNVICDQTTLKKQKTSLKYDRNYTLELTGIFTAPVDCMVDFNITASKYGILFVYNNDDILYNRFSTDYSLYNNYSNNNWVSVENNTAKITRINVRANDTFIIKILHTEDSLPSNYENNLNFTVGITDIMGSRKEYTGIKLLDIFKFNNSYNNITTIYSTPSIVYNKDKILVIANGGSSGENNNNFNNGIGGCSYYEDSSSIVKKCEYQNAENKIRSINGANGAKIPTEFNDLKTIGYSDNFIFGSGGGGAYLNASGIAGKGGINAGNGLNFNDIPSLSLPAKNTGGGAGGNTFLNNITNSSTFVNKLSGANGIIILKVKKNNEVILLQLFENKNKKIENFENYNIVDNYKLKLENIYKTNNININDKQSILNLIKSTDHNNYKLLISKILTIYGILENLIPKYLNIQDKFKYQIKFVCDNLKESLYIDEKYCVFNFYDSKQNCNLIINNFFNNNINGKNEFIYVDNNDYQNILKTSLLFDDNYATAYIRNEFNELIKPDNISILIESISKNFFHYLICSNNYKLYTSINNYATNNNEVAAIADILRLTKEIEESNKIYFDTTYKHFDTKIDVTLDDKNKYIQDNYKFDKETNLNRDNITNINNKLNTELQDYNLKYNINKTDNFYTYLVYGIVLAVFVVFFFTYINFEESVRPFVLLILLIIIISTIIFIILQANTNFNLFETFNCDNISVLTNYDTSQSDIKYNLCKNQFGNEISENINLPYYYISGDADSSKYILLKPTNNILVDILVYGNPYIVNTVTYFQPNINIYKKVLLPKNYTYKIYNNKIEKISTTDNTNIVIINGDISRSDVYNNGNVLNVYDCSNNRIDICDITKFTNKKLQNLRNVYTETGTFYNNTFVNNSDGYKLTSDDYDFYGTDKYNVYSLGFINSYVGRNSFITIKVIDDNYSIQVKKIENAIHMYKSSIENLEVNINLYLIQKNTKQLYNFSSEFAERNKKYYDRVYDKQKNLYNTKQSNYNILRRDLKTRYYNNIGLLFIVAVILSCFMIYQFYPNQFSNLVIIGFILIFIILFLIIYNIVRNQHIITNKYYFKKPEQKF
jgi:hypothetical protein